MQDRGSHEIFYKKIKQNNLHPQAFKSLCHFFCDIWEDLEKADREIIRLSKAVDSRVADNARLLKSCEMKAKEINGLKAEITKQKVVLDILEQANKRIYYMKD